MQVSQDGAHGLLELFQLATLHGPANVQHKDDVFCHWLEVFWSEEVDEVAVTYLWTDEEVPERTAE